MCADKERLADELKEDHVWVVPKAIRDRMKALNFRSQEAVAEKCALTRSTISRAINDRQILITNLGELAKALETTPEALQPMSTYQRAQLVEPGIVPPYDWEIVQMVTAELQAANGITYCTAKLRGTHMQESCARGKLYRLLNVQPAKRADLHEKLSRHVKVCERIKNSSFIARHRTIFAFQDTTAWWVLDDWITGRTLEEVIDSAQPLDCCTVGRIGMQILHGLRELHAVNIIARELAPERVYLSDDLTHLTLTDFEMAKLLEKGAISVSGKWKTLSPYRAPENMDSATTDPNFSVDLYSWSAIVSELLTGNPKAGLAEVAAAVGDSKLANALIGCRSDAVRKRPQRVDQVVQFWQPWAEAQKSDASN